MKEKTPHILNAASNLLGFCFFVFATIRSLGVGHATFIDSTIAISILFLALSVFFSFLSIRTSSGKRSALFEGYADYTFLAGVLCIVAVVMLIAFNVVPWPIDALKKAL